jgi:cellulose synthase/poly-beta-1,6-N-acetylglucosamine synthase-like glycosyltransferase
MPKRAASTTPSPTDLAALEFLFWTLIATVCWCYVGYPAYVMARARLRPRRVRRAPSDWCPSVTVIVAVRNGAATLARRVENVLGQSYPPDRLDMVIVANGSDDGTEIVARELARRNPRVRVLVSAAERGKAGAINMAVAAVTADVIVFADSRQTFASDAVARLVDPLADPTVGAVTGRLVVRRSKTAGVEGVRFYWGLETRLREAEGQSGSVVGATGAIYAARRRLVQMIPANLILDDVYVPVRIAMDGHRVVMAPNALAYDMPATDQRAEYARKRRTMVGNIQLIRAIPGLLSPVRNPLFIRFVSHKLLRVLSPFCFVALLCVAAFLPGWSYRAFFVTELSLYLLGGLGLVIRVPALSLPSAFVLIHGAVFAAAWRWRDDASHVWVRSDRNATSDSTHGTVADGSTDPLVVGAMNASNHA